MNIPKPFTNHNGGKLNFGSDGLLYFGTGDGGSGGDPNNLAQNTTSLLGKMLRIDVNNFTTPPYYTIPPSNPYATDVVNKKEIFSAVETLQRSKEFYAWLDKRRTVRDFSSKPVANEVIENILLTASSAPSGAHKQPWTFCIVSNPAIKKQIRESAEKEERESYENRMSDEWLKDLEPLGTNERKEFLEKAPALIVL